MSEWQIVLAMFLFVMAVTGACLLLVSWRLNARRQSVPVVEIPENQQSRLWPVLVGSVRLLGEVATGSRNGDDPTLVSGWLAASGFTSPHALTLYHGARFTAVTLAALISGWVGLFIRQSLTGAALFALAGAALAALAAPRVLKHMAQARVRRIERAIPPALDLMILSLESGQPIDAALQDAGRELQGLFPDLSGEFLQVHRELRAGRSRQDVYAALGTKNRSPELRKLAAVLIDSDRFGTSLAPALRTHARYLRIRRRQSAQERARQLTTKMVFPIFFFIMPAIFVVAVGPAILELMEAFSSGAFTP
jgi:tight adherence protein C